MLSTMNLNVRVLKERTAKTSENLFVKIPPELDQVKVLRIEGEGEGGGGGGEDWV